MAAFPHCYATQDTPWTWSVNETARGEVVPIRNRSMPQGGGRRALAERAIVLLLTAWGLAMVLPSLIQVVHPLGAFGLTADNNGALIDVVQPFERPNDSPSVQAGLAPGDQIDLTEANCRSPTSEACASVIAVLGGLGGLQYALSGRELTLPMLQGRSPSRRTVHLRAVPASLRWPAQVLLLANTIVAVMVILIAVRLLWTRPGAMTWGFFVYALWFNPGQTYAYYALLQLAPIAALVEQFGEALLRAAGYGGLIVFALRFPAGTVERRWRMVDRAVPFIVAGLALLMLYSSANLFGIGTEQAVRALLLSGFAVDALVIGILLLRRRRLHPQDDQRMRWVIAGFVIGLPAFIVAAICQSSGLLQNNLGIWPSQVAIGLLYLLNGVLAYFVSVAVRRRRVISVSVPLRHGTIVALLTVVISIPIFWLHETLSDYHHEMRLPSWFWPFVMGPIAIILFQRLHELAVGMVDRMLSGRFHKVRERLHRAGNAMLQAGSFAEVDRLLTAEPVGALRLTSGAVFRLTDGAYRRGEHPVGWGSGGPEVLRPERDQLVLGSADARTPVRLPRGTWDAAAFREEEQGPCIAVAVRGGAKEAAAIALFGPHRDGTDINRDEGQMLQELASRAALAYDRVETEILRQEVRRLRQKLGGFVAAPEG